ncbi:MAG: hypothetical protein QOH31_5976 [Verrucomicrobiota bacterium]|jgi:hypothetical protein
MTDNDSEQRRQESNDYLNRQDDESDFEERLRKRSEGVYKAILDKKAPGLYWESGTVSSDPSDASPHLSSESKESLGDRLLYKRQWIIESLGLSLVPSGLKREWARRLESLTESSCTAELENLGKEIRRERRDSMMRADIWNPSRVQDVDRDFASLEESLQGLREMWSRYITKYR